MTRTLAALLLLTATAVAQPTPDPDPVAQARALYTEGKRFYDIGDYATAIETWKRAYVVSSAPMLLFNIAQAYRLSGDCPTALKIYASYEREAKPVTNPEELEAAKTRCIREPTTTNPPPDPVKPAPPPAPATTASLAEPEAEVRPEPEVPIAEPRADSGRTLRTAGLITGAAGGVLVVTGIIFAVRASSIATEIEDYRGEWTTEQRARERSGQRARTIALGAGLTGVAALVTGGVLYMMGRRGESEPAVAIAITPTHAEVSWHVSF